ncbi:MAG: hypothetical protein M0Z84_03565 [Gammaproteobacteria bacterium]|nr:hypothetical protein [Gammaproteobacteria bacterium]
MVNKLKLSKLNWRSKTGDLVVRPRYSSKLMLVAAGLAGALLIVAGGAIYNHGMSMAGFDRIAAIHRQRALRDELAHLRSENHMLRAGLADAQRAVQMDQTAYRQLDKSLRDSTNQIVKLQEQVAFYQDIISPADNIAGPRIQALRIERLAGPNQYHYQLMLIQALKHQQTVYGRATLQVSGVESGKSAVLTFPGPNDKPLLVNFKYFQELDGKIALASDFTPQRVTVRVTTGGRELTQTYAWPKL